MNQLSLTHREGSSSCITAYPECMVRRLDASEKREGQGWSAQMYTALIGVKGLRATMECASLSSHLVMQSWKTSSGFGFGERRV